MEIICEQEYEISNLISKSGKYTAMEFQKILVNMVNTFKEHSISKEDYFITTTKAFELINGEQVLDVEILLPVTYRMPVDEPYIFKNRLKLVNVIYTKITDITKLQDGINMVNQYIIDQKIQPITSAFLIQKKENNHACIEIYIGINPNVN